MTFNRGVVGSTPALAATYGPWASPLLTVACALWCETRIQYACCSREPLRVVEEVLKGGYRNGQNECSEVHMLCTYIYYIYMYIYIYACIKTVQCCIVIRHLVMNGSLL